MAGRVQEAARANLGAIHWTTLHNVCCGRVWVVLPTMAGLTTTALASTVLHCELAVPHNRNAGGSPVHAKFKRLGAVRALSSTAHAVNQAHEGFSGKLVRRGRRGRGLVRSQTVSDVEAPKVGNAEAENLVYRVVIVGGGIAGLSAAVALHRY